MTGRLSAIISAVITAETFGRNITVIFLPFGMTAKRLFQPKEPLSGEICCFGRNNNRKKNLFRPSWRPKGFLLAKIASFCRKKSFGHYDGVGRKENLSFGAFRFRPKGSGKYPFSRSPIQILIKFSALLHCRNVLVNHWQPFIIVSPFLRLEQKQRAWDTVSSPMGWEIHTISTK